jgi:hypothetical protein
MVRAPQPLGYLGGACGPKARQPLEPKPPPLHFICPLMLSALPSWCNQLNPCVNKEPFSEEEDAKILEARA